MDQCKRRIERRLSKYDHRGSEQPTTLRDSRKDSRGPSPVIPAKAGIQTLGKRHEEGANMMRRAWVLILVGFFPKASPTWRAQPSAQRVLTGRLSVDGLPQDWPRGGSWWFVPVSLARGLHHLHLEGVAGTHPALDVRFGGQGTQRLDGQRFRHAE